MKAKEKNPYIKFYTEHNISPVHQDIDNLDAHILRREKLYRMLGLPVVAFSRKRILEIGPGSGHNAIIFFHWGADVDFVEPNPKAQEELEPLLRKFNVDKNRWRLFKGRIEDYETDSEYDIVIAEGFIQCIPNKRQVVKKVSSLVKPGGVVIVTCADDISYFFEYLKRIVAFRLIQLSGIKSFNKKVEVLTKAFSSHFDSLKHASRFIEDWVADNFLNPEGYGSFFSIADCIDIFGDEFKLLGSSPSMFTDYSWYKDYNYDCKGEILQQFYTKRHVLMLTGLTESLRDIKRNARLLNKIRELRRIVEDSANDIERCGKNSLIGLLEDIKSLSFDIDEKISKIINEVEALLKDKDLTPDKIANAENFACAFGRGQQYVSMVKDISLRGYGKE